MRLRAEVVLAIHSFHITTRIGRAGDQGSAATETRLLCTESGAVKEWLILPEIGLTFFDERGHALALSVRAEQWQEELSFSAQPLGERCLERTVDRLLRERYRDR